MKARFPTSGILFSAAALLGAAVSPALADVSSAPGLSLKVEPKSPPQTRPFLPHQVRLLPGPFKEAEQISHAWLLQLEPDRLLAHFRSNAGLEPKAPHYGGWEEMGVSGHSCGHYLSACAHAWAATGDQRFRERVNYIVAELDACQRAEGDGYVSAVPDGRRVYQEISKGDIRTAGFDLNGIWVPLYTQHKVMAGLRDAFRLVGNARALEVERGFADYLERIFKPLSDEQMQKVMVCEFGGVHETLADLWADTGESRYLELARRFHHQALIDPLARGEDVLPGKHANTQIPKLIASATFYELEGRAADRAAADFFWDSVVHRHSYVTGGHCDHEYFGQPGKLNDRLSASTTETCNVYNMLKLSRHVLGWRDDPAVGDFMERALINHIRASQHPDGGLTYNLSLLPGHHKQFQDKFRHFTCCVGTGMESHVRYGDSIWFENGTGVTLNQFIASELDWNGRKLRLETAFPEQQSFQLTLQGGEPAEFQLRLRHPAWAPEMSLKINGEPLPTDSAPGKWLVLSREWRPGDVLHADFPFTVRSEAMPDNPDRIALFHGPVLLAADLGPVDDPAAGDPFHVPVLVTDGKPIGEWLATRGEEPSHFATSGVGRPREVDLKPFFRTYDHRYTVYFDRFTPAAWQEKAEQWRIAQERRQALEARTLDLLRIAEMQPERDHNLDGERTGVGEAFGRKWRHATDGGWFAFDLAVADGQAAELVVTYWGEESIERNFDILADGTRIGSQRLHREAARGFFDVSYPLPADLTRGKDKVRVRFQARPGSIAGGVFGVRLLKPEQTPESGQQ